MEYIDAPQCDFLSLGFAFDEGHGAAGETNAMAAASLQHCNGTELSNYNFNGTGIEIYNNQPCSFKGSLDVINPLNGSQFVDYIKSIVSNASELANKRIYFSENDLNHPKCNGLILDLVHQSEWLSNYTSDGSKLLEYRGNEFVNCVNATKNWNSTSDLLGMARKSAYEFSLDKSNCELSYAPIEWAYVGAGLGLAAVCFALISASAAIHKKCNTAGYQQV